MKTILVIGCLCAASSIGVSSPTETKPVSRFTFRLNRTVRDKEKVFYHTSPQYGEALLKRIKDRRRSAKEDMDDMLTLLGILGDAISPEDIHSSKTEIGTLAQEVCTRGVFESLKLIASGKMHPDDCAIEIGKIKDVIELFEITAEELDVSQKAIDELLEHKR